MRFESIDSLNENEVLNLYKDIIEIDIGQTNSIANSCYAYCHCKNGWKYVSAFDYRACSNCYNNGLQQCITGRSPYNTARACTSEYSYWGSYASEGVLYCW